MTASVKGLGDIIEKIESELDEKDEVRELAIKAARAITRQSRESMQRMHRGEDYGKQLEDVKGEIEKITSLLGPHPDIFYSGILSVPFQEYVEARVLGSILEGAPLPSPDVLSMPATVYLMGLGDVIGELRRFALDSIRKDNYKLAEEYLVMMEELYSELMRFDYPSALVGIRRKQDVARSLIDKTSGELILAKGSAMVQKSLGK